MDRKHIPKLDIEKLGQKGVVGWYFEPCNLAEGSEDVVFQCPHNHRAALVDHSIEPDGTVNASVLCWENDYHEFVILDGWPTNKRKRAGSHTLETI